MSVGRVVAHPSEQGAAELTTLEERVVEHCRRHSVLVTGESALVLLSGGPDSACALDALVRVHRGPIRALVVDHGLRAGSDREAERAAAIAEALGVGCAIEQVEVGATASLQDAARVARWEAARRVAATVGATCIVTGHTADDQAETVLFRIARGAGRTGALGMAPRTGDIARPVLCLRASETRHWCQERGLAPIQDPSNADSRFARVRVRTDALPALERVHAGAGAHLADLAELLRDEAEVLEPIVDAAWQRCQCGDGLAVESLRAEHDAIQRLLVRRLLGQAGAPGEALGRRSVERARGVLATGAAATLPGPVDVSVQGSVLVADLRAARRPVALTNR